MDAFQMHSRFRVHSAWLAFFALESRQEPCSLPWLLKNSRRLVFDASQPTMLDHIIAIGILCWKKDAFFVMKDDDRSNADIPKSRHTRLCCSSSTNESTRDTEAIKCAYVESCMIPEQPIFTIDSNFLFYLDFRFQLQFKGARNLYRRTTLTGPFTSLFRGFRRALCTPSRRQFSLWYQEFQCYIAATVAVHLPSDHKVVGGHD